MAIARQLAPPPPPKANEAAPPTTPASPDSSDVTVLDPFFVEDEKFPEFPERRMLDARGHLERHYKREPGLRLGAMSPGNDIVARERNEIELAHERGQEMKDLFGLTRITEKPPRDVQKKVNEARSRTTTDAPQSGGAFREKKE